MGAVSYVGVVWSGEGATSVVGDSSTGHGPQSSGQFANYDLKSKVSKERLYNGFKYIAPTWWGFALTTTTEGELNFGLSTSGNDPLNQHYYDATLFYNDIYNTTGKIGRKIGS